MCSQPGDLVAGLQEEIPQRGRHSSATAGKPSISAGPRGPARLPRARPGHCRDRETLRRGLARRVLFLVRVIGCEGSEGPQKPFNPKSSSPFDRGGN